MARKGKIDELYDLAKLEAQQEKAIAFVNEFIDTLNKVKPMVIKLEGAEKTKEVIDGMKEVAAATAKVSEVSSKAVNSMGQLVDMSNKAAGSYEKQANLITKFAGTLEQNIRLQTQYKVRLDEISKALKEQKEEYAKGTTSLEAYTTKVAALSQEQQELKVASSEIGQTIKAQIKDNQAAEESYDSLNHRLGLLRDAYRQLSAEERDGEHGKALMEQITPLDAKLKQLDGSMGNFQRNVGNYGTSFSGALKTLENALQEVKEKMDQMNQSGNANADVMTSLQQEYDLLSQIVGSQAEGFASMRSEIRANEQAIEQLISVYGQDSEIVQQLIHQNAELRDSFADLVATQRTLGSDTFTWDAMLQGGQALIGFYSAAQGAAALFGDENEDLQKTMVKLQAAMALVQGVQAAVNALQREGALVQGLLAARTAISTVATRAYTFATAGATAAARAFNTALLAGGIGIVLTLIATAASAMGAFSDETDVATQSLEDFNAELEFSNILLNGTVDSLKFSNDLLIEKLKKRGATEKEINAQSIASLKEIKAAYIDQAKTLKENLDSLISRGEGGEKAKKLIDEITSLKLKAIGIDRQIELDQARFETKMSDDAKKRAKERADKAKEYAEKEFKARFELGKLSLQLEIDRQKAIAEADVSPSVRIAARLKQFEGERKMALAEKEFALTNTKLTVSERELIVQNSLDKIKGLELKAANDIIAIRKSSNDADIQAANETMEAITAAMDAQTAKRANFLQGLLDDQLSLIQRNANEQLQVELDKYTLGKISKEQYEEAKLKIETEAHRKSILAQIQYYEDLIKLANLAPDAEKEALKALADYKQQLYDLDVKKQEEANEKKAKSNADFFKTYKDELQALQAAVTDTVFSALEGGIEREKNATQEQIDLLEQKKAKEIETVNQTVTNRQQAADEIAIIEARANAQKEALERRQRQLDEQKAKFDRLRTIANIVQNTAQGVTAALTSIPPNVPLSILVGAIGAAQLVSVLAKPLPKYAQGTEDHPGGYAIVGDGGKKEYVQTPSGEVYETPNTPTVMDIPEHSKVFKSEFDLMDAMHRQHISTTSKAGVKAPNDHYQFQNMTATLGKKLDGVTHAIRNIPQPIIEATSPVKNWVHSNGSTHHI